MKNVYIVELILFERLDSSKNATGLGEILGLLVAFWEKGDTTSKTKCMYCFYSEAKRLKLNAFLEIFRY
jgi:hypothetical protein